MPALNEINRMLASIRWDRKQIEDVHDLIDSAVSAMRDAEALIGALADEIAEMKGAASEESEE